MCYLRRVLAQAYSQTLAYYGGPNWIRLIVLPIVGFAIGACVHWLWDGREAVMDEIKIAASYGVCGAVGTFVLVFIVNLVAAPVRLYRAMEAERDRLRSELGETARNWLEISFDPQRDRFDWDDSTLFRVVIGNNGGETIPCVGVKIKSIEPLQRKRHRRNQVKPLFEAPLRLTHDHTIPGRAEFKLDSNDGQSIDVVQAQRGAISIAIWAASTGSHPTVVPGPPPRLEIRPVAIPIPAASYDITILAHGHDVMACQRTFRISVPRGKLAFKPL